MCFHTSITPTRSRNYIPARSAVSTRVAGSDEMAINDREFRLKTFPRSFVIIWKNKKKKQEEEEKKTASGNKHTHTEILRDYLVTDRWRNADFQFD